MAHTFRMPRGGHYWHAVLDGQQQALCGHVPRVFTRREVSWQEGWRYEHRSTPAVQITCARCLACLGQTRLRGYRTPGTKRPW